MEEEIKKETPTEVDKVEEAKKVVAELKKENDRLEKLQANHILGGGNIGGHISPVKATPPTPTEILKQFEGGKLKIPSS